MKTTREKGAIAQRAWELYQRRIRQAVEPEHMGEFLVINVDTGDYLLDKDDVAVMERAAALYPPGSLFGMRVGHSTMGRIGFCELSFALTSRITACVERDGW